jgi:hypothetical protein
MIALEGDGYVMISAVDGALGWDRLSVDRVNAF